MVPVRAGPLFAATEKENEPLPDLEFPPVTVIHGLLLTAFQEQPFVSTVAELAPADDPKFWEFGVTPNVHGIFARNEYALIPPITGLDSGELVPSSTDSVSTNCSPVIGLIEVASEPSVAKK